MSETLVSIGYTVVLPRMRDPGRSEDLLPPLLWSRSECLCAFLPGMWCISWVTDTEAARREQAERFGVDPGRFHRLLLDVTNRIDGEVRYPDACVSLAVARELADYVGNPACAIVGAAVRAADVEAILEETRPPPMEGCAPTARPAIGELAERREAPEAGGDVLGWEPLAVEGTCGVTCSWICNGLERDFVERESARPNAHGLIEDGEVASRFARWIQAEGNAEPGLWVPVRLTRYGRN
jgi:hypothetical protein